MNTFSTLPVAERQAQVNAVLVPATKRLPLKIKRNATVMGQVVRYVWDSLKNSTKLSQASVISFARKTAGA